MAHARRMLRVQNAECFTHYDADLTFARLFPSASASRPHAILMPFVTLPRFVLLIYSPFNRVSD